MAGKNRAPAAVLRAFLAGQGDVSRAKDANGWTSLHLVCYLPFSGSEECLDVILGNGGDVAAQTIEGLTPLHLACCDGQCGAVSKLLARGARIDARSADRQTPLMFAAKLGHDQVSILLFCGNFCRNPPAFEVPHASMLHRSNTSRISALIGIMIHMSVLPFTGKSAPAWLRSSFANPPAMPAPHHALLDNAGRGAPAGEGRGGGRAVCGWKERSGFRGDRWPPARCQGRNSLHDCQLIPACGTKSFRISYRPRDETYLTQCVH